MIHLILPPPNIKHVTPGLTGYNKIGIAERERENIPVYLGLHSLQIST